MNVNELFFWINVSIVANVYLDVLLLRRWPQLRFIAYVLNLSGMSICAYSIALAQPSLGWAGFFLLNLIFQNVLLVHPKGTGYYERKKAGR